ncbi:glyoxalase [Streptomyces sp. NPDC058417]|uniref:glyoxalase n=1 Tax=unclassified Streptomyces TaxID=2593676 RepID=UPI0036540654
MTSLATVTVEAADVTAAQPFYAALGLDHVVRLRASDAPTSGFRGFALALTVARPATVDAFLDAAVAAGGTAVKPGARSFWGYGGVVRSPDGTLCKVATSAKRDSGPATREIDAVVLLLGATDVAETKRFHVEHGLTVAKSFGRKYVEFDAGDSPVRLALYGRRALAKDLGVPEEGTGSHRVVLGGTAGPATDPDGFAWEPTPSAATEASPSTAPRTT